MNQLVHDLLAALIGGHRCFFYHALLDKQVEVEVARTVQGGAVFTTQTARQGPFVFGPLVDSLDIAEILDDACWIKGVFRNIKTHRRLKVANLKIIARF